MKIIETKIEGLFVIEPDVFKDERGYFFEVYNQERFFNKGMNMIFVQDNESKSKNNVLRGLHFQKPPFAQGKLVRVMQGRVLDVAVDLRKNSSTYGKYHAVELDAITKNMFYIPEGFAHGFLTLEDDTIFSYKCTNYYNKESEGSLLWNDETINIDWNTINPTISEKDKNAPLFKDFISPF
ncbi:MAG: dTDP-4-dehydrorhamnose 3,5-epimerase [Bacteroidales bacterium]|jgi:dTDP-4-dehydrorhamnose 3,5-epimerase|nr:dTDP-4-dehydrorhamnose 3,5-epimerase [Bacteroidales bacterium]